MHFISAPSCFFIQAFLPPLRIGVKPDISFEEFIFLCTTNLCKADLLQIRKVRELIDISNIRALLSGHKLDTRGNYTEKELDEALLLQSGFSSYVFEFLNQFETNGAKLNQFAALLALFLREETQKAAGFLRRYFQFERGLRLVITALRAKQLGRDFTKVFQFEDFSDPFILYLLAQKDGEKLELPAEYVAVKELLTECGKDPLAQHKAVLQWKFSCIEQMCDAKEFTIDAVLAYMVCLLFVEDDIALNQEMGKEALKACVD